MNKICCIFLNNGDLYDKKYAEIASSVDYIDFFNVKPNWHYLMETFEDMFFNEDIHEIVGLHCGNEIFALIDFKLKHNDYDYYFVMENDTLFTGDYKLLFDELTRDLYNYDAIIQDMLWYPPKDWLWTKEDRYYNLIDGFSIRRCHNLLYKLYCFSNALVNYVFNGYVCGYYGHQDLCVSCILKEYNGRYDYLPSHFNIKITPNEFDITEDDLKKKNMILHPVKIKKK